MISADTVLSNPETGRNRGTGVLHALFRRSYLEIMPTRSARERVVHIPAGSWVGISCSPAAGIGPTLDLVDRINARYGERSLKLVPHIAARVIRDRAHLDEIVTRLEEAGVRSIFVPGGDSKVPAGDYACALELLRDLAERGHRFVNVGIAAHPEGHPIASEEMLLAALLDKQRYASYLVTQLCFDPGAIVGWLRRIRDAGVTLHAWLGLPGIMEIPKLLSLSLRIGVGRSARMLTNRKGLARNLFAGHSYCADDLLDGLVPALDDSLLGVSGFHLYSFNNVEATERWRIGTIKRLENREDLDP